MPTSTFLASTLYVFLGGGLGAWLRFAAGRLLPSDSFPWATLSVNVIGSFAMGLLAAWLARAGGAEELRLLLGVGLLGGFTTFSAFSLEIVQLAQRGSLGLAGLYVALSLAGGVAALFVGLKVFA